MSVQRAPNLLCTEAQNTDDVPPQQPAALTFFVKHVATATPLTLKHRLSHSDTPAFDFFRSRARVPEDRVATFRISVRVWRRSSPASE